MSNPSRQGNLYERIGGAPAITAAVELFYEKVLADPFLSPFFLDSSMQRLKAHQFAFLSQALGGPRSYNGASMQHAHKRLVIEQRHFDAVAMHLIETLRDLSVPEDIITEVGSAIAPLASQVVNTPTLAGAI